MLHALEPSEPPDQTFDIIVCGSGSSGSVVARRLSDNPNINLLLIESGGMNFTETIRNAARWPENIGAAEDWGFVSEPVAGLNGRSLLMSMGKVVGGSSSINAMIWARGHRSDWDYYASESGDAAWGYDAIQKLYRSIEDYRGASDTRRGTEGPVTVFQPSQPHPIAIGLLAAAESLGIPRFANPNGRMMEERSGCAITDIRADGRERMSIFDSYLRPVFGRSNLTILTGGTVERVVLEKGRAVGVDVVEGRKRHHFRAAQHVVLSTGSINTPRILMQSGIGPEAELRRLGIQTAQHLPGVGENLQDHICFPSIFEYREPMEPRGNGSAATVYAAVNAESTSPDVLVCQGEFPICSPEIVMKHSVPPHAWSLVAGLARPRSRGRVRLRSADPRERVLLELNSLSDPDDLKTARAAVEFSQQIGAQAGLGELTKGEVYPGETYRDNIDLFLRESAVPFWHQTCTAKMGRDEMSVVDAKLKVYGIDNLMIADGSVFPRIPTGNTMAPCVVVGERAARILTDQLL
ncbi:GMC family oxidoreductase [Rhizobium mayense]|uniref:GMC family oxidoreductase n=1 Tax=Rhizobium mayense TaxID=1312184 RepID=UPI00398C344B